jgi:hypothetical protein
MCKKTLITKLLLFCKGYFIGLEKHKKIEECVHRAWMPPLPAKVNRYFPANQEA